jgi:hypothetical protein
MHVKLSRLSGALAVAALAIFASSYAPADDDGWYIGANAGLSRAKIDDPRITSSLIDEGFAVTGINNDDSHFGYKLIGGYQFDKYFALEGGYFDLGKFSFTANTLPPGSLAGDLKLSGVNLDRSAFCLSRTDSQRSAASATTTHTRKTTSRVPGPSLCSITSAANMRLISSSGLVFNMQ